VGFKTLSVVCLLMPFVVCTHSGLQVTYKRTNESAFNTHKHLHNTHLGFIQVKGGRGGGHTLEVSLPSTSVPSPEKVFPPPHLTSPHLGSPIPRCKYNLVQNAYSVFSFLSSFCVNIVYSKNLKCFFFFSQSYIRFIIQGQWSIATGS